jgi:hypothetical protein
VSVDRVEIGNALSILSTAIKCINRRVWGETWKEMVYCVKVTYFSNVRPEW